MFRKWLLPITAVVLTVWGCTHDRGELGSEKNPIKFFIVPSVDVKVIEESTKLMQKYLEAHTPYKYKIGIPASYIAVVEAFGTNRADVASINPYGYVMAHERYGAQALLMTIRHGESSYKAQFLAKANGPIKKLEDFNGKKFAYVDPSSISGYLMPLKIFKDRGIKPKETVFAMRHDNVVSMIYQGQVDGGVTFYSPPDKGEIQDARRLVLSQYPDVEKKVKIVELSPSIPNDPIVFRKDMPEEMKKKVIEGIIAFAKTPEGKDSMQKLSSVTGFQPCTDKDYDSTRDLIKSLGKVGSEIEK
jgi:phosphonate transport system substrate-binding protein